MKFDDKDKKYGLILCIIVVVLLTFGGPIINLLLVVTGFLFTAAFWVIASGALLLACLFVVKITRKAVSDWFKDEAPEPLEEEASKTDFYNDGKTSVKVDIDN